MNTSQYFLLQDLTVIVVAAAISTWICSLFRMPLMLGYIVAGVLLSPVFGLIHDSGNIAQIGELGVLFMMFFVGMEFNPDRIKKVFAPSVFGILFQIVSMLVLGLVAARIMGMNSTDGLFLGAVLSMSSTIVMVELFTQREEMNKGYAQIAVGILVAEDLFAIFMMVMLSSMGGENSGINSERDMLSVILQRCLALSTFVVTIYVLGKMLAPLLLKRFAMSNNPQVLIMFTFSIIMGLGALAFAADLSLALGAFLAGSILSGTIVSDRVENLTNSFRNLFVALFFVSVGTMLKPGLIIEMWLPILTLSVALIVFRTAACFLGILVGGTTSRDAYLAAVNKAQIGEFSFVIAGLGISLGIMNPAILSIAMGVAFITIFATPFFETSAEPTMRFFSKITPLRIKLFLDLYSSTIREIGESARKKTFLRLLAKPIIRIAVYIFFFNAILVLAMIVYGIISDSHLYGHYTYLIVWGTAALFSLPIVTGLVRNIDESTKILIATVIHKRKIEKDEATKRAGILHAVFSTLAVAFFSAVFFLAMRYHFPKNNALYVYCAIIVVFSVIFWRFLVRANENMQFAFSVIFKRHLKNVEHYRREKWSKKSVETIRGYQT